MSNIRQIGTQASNDSGVNLAFDGNASTTNTGVVRAQPPPDHSQSTDYSRFADPTEPLNDDVNMADSHESGMDAVATHTESTVPMGPLAEEQALEADVRGSH